MRRNDESCVLYTDIRSRPVSRPSTGRSTVDQLSVSSRSTIGRRSVDCLPTADRQWTYCRFEETKVYMIFAPWSAFSWQPSSWTTSFPGPFRSRKGPGSEVGVQRELPNTQLTPNLHLSTHPYSLNPAVGVRRPVCAARPVGRRFQWPRDRTSPPTSARCPASSAGSHPTPTAACWPPAEKKREVRRAIRRKVVRNMRKRSKLGSGYLCFTISLPFLLGDPGADRGPKGKLGQEDKRWRRGRGAVTKGEGRKALFSFPPLFSPTPLLRRHFSSHPSFQSTPQFAAGSPRKVTLHWACICK